jgi:hypothetical protein
MSRRIVPWILLIALSGCDAMTQGRDSEKPVGTQEQEATASLARFRAYELSERCGKTAGDEFRRNWPDPVRRHESGFKIADYSNHYQAKLNKCFYLLRITHITNKSKTSEQSVTKTMLLKDINEAKIYASFTSAPAGNAQLIGGAPMDCKVLGKACASKEDWEAQVKQYMED